MRNQNLTLKQANLIMKINKIIIFFIHLLKSFSITKKDMLFVMIKKNLGKLSHMDQKEKEDLLKLFVKMENYV